MPNASFPRVWKKFCHTFIYPDDREWMKQTQHLIERAYSEPHRHYHTITHIETMIDSAHTLRDRVNDYMAMRLAIIFHDIVYDPASQTNEENSVVFMYNCMSRFKDQITVDSLRKAEDMILATQSHHAAPETDPDVKLLLDIDMAILAQPWAIYERYKNQVAKEYETIYPRKDFLAARRDRFLKPAIDSKEIFFTAPFRATTDRAMENMAREVFEIDRELEAE